MRKRLLLLFTATALMSTPLAASALILDNFQEIQVAEIGIGGDAENPVEVSPDPVPTLPLEGNREIVLERTAGFGSASADVNGTQAGTFSLATGPGVVASAALTWSGFGTVDLTDDGSAFFEFSVRSDLNAVVAVKFLSGGDESSATRDVTGAGAGLGDPFQFLHVAFGDLDGTADLTAIDAFSLEISGPAALDLQIGELRTVQTPVTAPEPGTLALLGIGLAGLAHSSRRRA